jgi:hypothetical protein
MAIGIVGSNNGYSRTASDNRFLKLSGGTINGNLAINTGSISTSQPLTLTQTWNAAGVTFAAQVVNITTTNSANGSAFFDVKQNGISRFKVVKNSGATTAQIIINGGDANPCSFTCGGNSLSIAPEGNQDVMLANRFYVTRNGAGGNGLGGTITSTQTWNSILSIFTGFTMNVTDSNSNAASLLMDLRVGGVSQLKVTKAGNLTAGRFATTGFNGLEFDSINGTLKGSRSVDGGIVADLNLLSNSFSVGTLIAINGSVRFSANGDVTLARDAANTLAQRNGLVAQTSRIYGTFTARGTGTTSLEALEIKSQSAGSVIIQSLKGSAGGTARDIELRHGAVDTNGVITNGTLVATVKSTGLETTNLTASGDIEVTDSTKGIILKSPSGTRYRFTVSDLGTLTPTAL